MTEQTYRVWLTSNKAVVVNGEGLRELIAKQVAVTIREIGKKQPIDNPPGKPRVAAVVPVNRLRRPTERSMVSNRPANTNGWHEDVAGRRKFR